MPQSENDFVAHLEAFKQETERLKALPHEEFDRLVEESLTKKYKPYDPKKTALMLLYQKRRLEEEERLRASNSQTTR